MLEYNKQWADFNNDEAQTEFSRYAKYQDSEYGSSFLRYGNNALLRAAQFEKLAKENEDTLNTYRTWSVVLFVSGGVFLAAGGVLLFLRFRKKTPKTEQQA